MSVNLWAGSRKDWIDRRVRERHWEDGHQASPEMVRRWQIRYGRKYDAARLLLNSQDFRIPPTPENMDKLRALLSDAFMLVSDKEFSQHIREATVGS